MAKLDARNWMEFRIGDIFRMNNTKSIVQKDVVPDSGTVPYVTAQAGNNGVMTFIDCPPEWMDEGEFMTFDPSINKRYDFDNKQ